MITECCCPVGDGKRFCERHNMQKGATWRRLCQTDQEYFRAWERGAGPGQTIEVCLTKPDYNHWMPLHYYAVKHWNKWDEKEAGWWYAMWVIKLPRGCGCKENWNNEIKANPVDLSSAQGFFEWSWRIHDSVSERLKKTYRPTLADSYQIWFTEESINNAYNIQT